MEHAAALNPRTPRVWGDLVLVMVIGVAGVLMAHSPMILSGFRKLQVDLGDSRLIHYLLEHGYLWIRGTPGHREFWNPPFFYPAPNAAAYTDIFLTVGPPYWIYRAAGIPLDLSFGLWMVTMSALNYAAGVVLFRKGLRLDVLPSAAGSFLIAFGTPRINQIAHQQLLPCFYVLMTVYALARLFGDPAPGRAARLDLLADGGARVRLAVLRRGLSGVVLDPRSRTHGGDRGRLAIVPRAIPQGAQAQTCGASSRPRRSVCSCSCRW